MNDEQLEAKATEIAERLAAEMAAAEAKYGAEDLVLWRLRKHLNKYFELRDVGAPQILIDQNRKLIEKRIGEIKSA